MTYPHISIHAVSRDVSVFPFKPCILIVYAQPDEIDLEKETITHYRLIPPKSEQCEIGFCTHTRCISQKKFFSVETIFGLICEFQQLYPDSDLSSDSDMNDDVSLEEGNYFTTAEGLEYITAEGESVLSHLESILHIREEGTESEGTESRLNGWSIIIII